MVAIVAVQNVSVEPQPGGAYRITKTGGFDEAFDAPACSTGALADDFVLRARRVGGGGRLMIGVTADPAEDTGYVGIDYAMAYRASEAVVEVFERGNYRAYGYIDDPTIWIDRIGTTLTYRAGPRRQDAAVLRQVEGVAGALWFDSSLVTPGCAVDVRFARPGAWSDQRPARATLSIGAGLSL